MVRGVRFSGVASGIKPGALDLGLVFFEEPFHAVALYTKNRVKAAHILYNRRRVKNPVRALIVNSGCANACTGHQGVADVDAIAAAAANVLGVRREEILFASTGVIGTRIPVEKVTGALPELKRGLRDKNVELFARAIMTTDTHPKIVQGQLPGKNGMIVGVAKGSGMINPLFATMLSFLFTDAVVPYEGLKRMVPLLAKESFERITVDGETSTNDTVIVFAPSRPGADDPKTFRDALGGLMRELSRMIVKDGEGATKVVHVTVAGARRKEFAEKLARRIATSPLCKTAFFGCDPNWGRIIAAAGDANVPIDQNKVEIVLQGETLVKDGVEVPFSEEKLKKLMDRKELELVVNLYGGRASYDIYTTDLTFDYVKINASYRT